jgi:hypothetical protein
MKMISILLIALLTVSANASTEGFELKADKQTGSRIAKRVITSNMPFYKSYKELSEEEKELVRSDYQGLRSNDVPPYPAAGMGPISEPLIRAHKKLNKAGELFVIAKITATGTVDEVTVYKTPGKKMSQMAGAVLFETKFSPGTCQGKPCESEFLLKWDFEKYGSNLSIE